MSLLPLLLVGCFGASKFDGTWLFALDPEGEVTGDCAPDDEGEGEYSYTGTDNTWVDIYKTGDGGLVVLFEESLIGTAEGSALSAEWVYEVEGDGYASQDQIELDGELASGELTGDITWSYTESDGEDVYSCVSSTSYTAWQTTTGPNEIAGN